jgi:TRAP-type C4-dicarboxylate transport system substrate-binding protein
MSTYRLSVQLMGIALIGVIAITACAPSVASTPIPSTVASAPTTQILPTNPTPEASPAVEAPPLEFRGHKGDLWGVTFSPDGKYLATGSHDGTARLWDIATGQTIRIFSGHTGEVEQVAFSPDGKYLLTAGEGDQTARLWDVASGAMVQVFSGHTGGVAYIAFSPDGKTIATGGGDPTARIWDITSGATLNILNQGSPFSGLAFSPDGKYLLTASEGGTVHLWDMVTGNKVRDFDDLDNVSAATYSPDGKYVAIGLENGKVTLLDPAAGQMVREFSGHQSLVTNIEFSPDGRYLLTGSWDQTARLWDLATGGTLHIFGGHRGRVLGVTFSPDGGMIATASNDTVARVWDLQASSAGIPPQNASNVTLRLAVADKGGRPSEPYVLEFIEQVKTLSNGNIIIEPSWDAGTATDAGFEVGVIQLVKTGQADLGLAASRAFDVENITSFQALQAPFLITNDPLAKAVATSDISTRMLDSLSSAGIVGLTTWPEDLRHPFSIIPGKPILSPEDFAGLNVRATPSEATYMLIDTMGGAPMMGNDYQAAESGLRQGASLTGTPIATGNVVFFAKFQVLFANNATFEKLSEAQRAILYDAAIATQAKAIAEHPSEVEAAAAWCADGGTVVMASEERVAAFEVAAQPVFDMIAQNPLNVELIAAIRELKANTEPSPGAQACGAAVGQ